MLKRFLRAFRRDFGRFYTIMFGIMFVILGIGMGIGIYCNSLLPKTTTTDGTDLFTYVGMIISFVCAVLCFIASSDEYG
jgi:hypothetical protein